MKSDSLDFNIARRSGEGENYVVNIATSYSKGSNTGDVFHISPDRRTIIKFILIKENASTKLKCLKNLSPGVETELSSEAARKTV